MKFIGLLALVTAGLLAFHFSHLDQYFRPNEIRAAIQSAGILGPALYLLVYSLGPTLFFPSWVLSMAGGLAFGPLWGTVLSLVGATAGASVAFSVARYLGRDTVAKLLRWRMKNLDEQAALHGFQVIFMLRLIPLVPFDVLDYMGGLSKIKTRDFILGTFLGIIPGTFAYVYLGHSLTDIYSWPFVLAIGLLILLGLIPVVYRRWKKQGAG